MCHDVVNVSDKTDVFILDYPSFMYRKNFSVIIVLGYVKDNGFYFIFMILVFLYLVLCIVLFSDNRDNLC